MTQLWRPVVDHCRYEVSEDGEIRHVKTKKIRKLQAHKVAPHYLVVTIWDLAAGKLVLLRVHQEVAKAFVPRGTEHQRCVLHVNDIKHDNRAKNLVWGTHKENTQMAIKNGRLCTGEQWQASHHERLSRMRAGSKLLDGLRN